MLGRDSSGPDRRRLRPEPVPGHRPLTGDQHGYEVAAIREPDPCVAPAGVLVETDDAHWHNGADWQQCGQVAVRLWPAWLAQFDRVAPVEAQQLAQLQPKAQVKISRDS